MINEKRASVVILLSSALWSLLWIAEARPPNFIIILSDDQGYQDLGCYGSRDLETPRLDQMAAEGMRFTDFYAQTVCGPSRAALMTGCYPLRVARQGDPNSIHPELHSEELTIAELLEPLGYRTGIFGKWDLAGHKPSDFAMELRPEEQGFEVSFWTPASNDTRVDLYQGAEKVADNAQVASLTCRYTDEALKFIEDSQSAPFFLYLAHTMPHTKLAASDQFKGTSAGGLYGDVIAELDFHTGRILDQVQELELDEITYLIFASDNGPWLIKKNHGGQAAPLRSGKTSCWEGGLRVPCIMRAPGKIPGGSECHAVCATLDLMPTLVSLAGGALPRDRVIDGIDLTEVLHGESSHLKRNFLYYQHDCLRAVRAGRWKLMLPHTEPMEGSIAVRWRPHISKKDAIRINAPRLYDLEADIGEREDVAALHPEVVAALTELAREARRDVGDHDFFGEQARSFGSERRTLSGGEKDSRN